jgi:SEC-C motif domain protein
MNNPIACPCGSAKPYSICCQPYHEGTSAPTAEALMRSRYSAYVYQLEAYLLKTWHSSTRPNSLNLTEDTQTRWLGLEVKRHVVKDESTATVEFVARYKVAGRAERLHEVSDFIKIDSQWYYIDGHHLS